MSKQEFSFDGNLEHQKQAVESIVDVFDFSKVSNDSRINPEILFDKFEENVEKIQIRNKITNQKNKNKHILDIQMETGTGKTYTYTKAMFELNKKLGINKFIIVVSSLSIKAGTFNFLTSEGCKQHFRDLYNKEIDVFLYESNKSSKKQFIPEAIRSFADADNKNTINVLLINSGMINSKIKINGEKIWSFEYEYDINLFNNYTNILDTLKSVKPVIIIDEPHKFKEQTKTWDKIIRLEPQLIIKFGATFQNEYNNLIYQLNAVEAFNKNLVKGIKVAIDDFDAGKKTNIKVKSIDNKLNQVLFEYSDGHKKKEKVLTLNDSLSLIDNNCINLKIDKIGSGKLQLSNGQELLTNDKINPYLFNQEFIHKMIQQSVEKHFEIEKNLMNKDVRIKPLTLFFIDDINSYRNEQGPGELVIFLEKVIKKNIEKQLQANDLTENYRNYLLKSLDDLSLTHGGYFSKDNTGKDEKIQKEVHEILHDKITLLDVDNPRRFIFSKWTLKEGWDNPNIFQITKLRSSGSETSKIQEVGRGLRIPVNEFMQRVDQEVEQHYLYYRVDFSESNFAKSLIDEINSTATNDIYLEPGKVITEQQKQYISEKLDIEISSIELELLKENIIDSDRMILDEAQEKLLVLFNDSVQQEKIIEDKKEIEKKCIIRENNYNKLKYLWEEINKQLILEYNISEDEFKKYLKASIPEKFDSNIIEKEYAVDVKNYTSILKESINSVESINTLNYGEFLLNLSENINVKIETLHEIFVELKQENILDISKYLTYETIRKITDNYYCTLRDQLISETKISFKTIDAVTKKTPFTDKEGHLIPVKSSNLGIDHEDGIAPDTYLFDDIYFDSKKEKENIMTKVESVEVYTKIPKRSVKIPVPGGRSYSPDFAYVVRDKYGKANLNLIVETKDKKEEDLNKSENEKIDLATLVFNDKVNITFKKQLSNKKIADIIEEIREK